MRVLVAGGDIADEFKQECRVRTPVRALKSQSECFALESDFDLLHSIHICVRQLDPHPLLPLADGVLTRFLLKCRILYRNVFQYVSNGSDICVLARGTLSLAEGLTSIPSQA